MPTDYKSHGRHVEKKPMPGFVWLFIGLAIGLSVAAIIYLDKQPASDVSFGEAVQKELDNLRQQNKPTTAEKKTADKSTNEPRFNFYTILPELEVLIPEAELKLEQSQNTTNNSKLTAGKQYMLQAGSFKNRQDADKLKASLALLGMEASIQPVSINREQWHRVRIGPYTNTRQLYGNLNQLHQHGINAMAMELKSD